MAASPRRATSKTSLAKSMSSSLMGSGLLPGLPADESGCMGGSIWIAWTGTARPLFDAGVQAGAGSGDVRLILRSVVSGSDPSAGRGLCGFRGPCSFYQCVRIHRFGSRPHRDSRNRVLVRSILLAVLITRSERHSKGCVFIGLRLFGDADCE